MDPNGSISKSRTCLKENSSRFSKGVYLIGPRSFDLAMLFDSFAVRVLGKIGRSIFEETSVMVERPGEDIVDLGSKEERVSGREGSGLRIVLIENMVTSSVCKRLRKGGFRCRQLHRRMQRTGPQRR